MEKKQKRPAHEVILSKLQDGCNALYMSGLAAEDKRADVTVCVSMEMQLIILEEMIIPREHRKKIIDKLRALKEMCTQKEMRERIEATAVLLTEEF